MNTQKYAGFAWPAMFVLVAGIFGYWASQRELVSSRPSSAGAHDVPDPVQPFGVRSFHSRMWQDPLSTSYEDWKQRRKERKLNAVQDGDKKNPIVDTVATNAAKRIRGEQKGKSLLADVIDLLTNSVTDDTSDREMKQFFEDLVRVRKNEHTLCLPVLLPGRPNDEDKEKRMRIRYAVVTALAESGYHLKLNQRMSYVTTKIWIRVLRGWREIEMVVPVKLYRHEDENAGNPQIFVLWINESQLGERHLLSMHRILNEIFETVDKPHRERLKVSIIGPASSDTLKLMTEKIKNLKGAADAIKDDAAAGPARDSAHWFISSYSPLRSVSGFLPLLNFNQDNRTFTDFEVFSPRATIQFYDEDDEADERSFPSESPATLHRIIGTDRQLANALQQELALRGAVPDIQSEDIDSSPKDTNSSEKRHRVVLITEHDTAYGREITKEFRVAFGESVDVKPFNILRGIDGRLPGEQGKQNESLRNGNQHESFELKEIVERPPNGRTQYDYLRRLVGRIEALPNVTAIGVVGSDVYDKLLVLRALKPHFPNCVFFTTDLDAIYCHDDERQHTRNLLIASHFALRLDEGLQATTPPFRDSYQTATFLATRLAIQHGHRHFGVFDFENAGKWNTIHNHWFGDRSFKDPDPLLHIVGKNDMRQLAYLRSSAANTKTSGPNNDRMSLQLHPSIPPSTRGWHYVFVIGVTLTGLMIAFLLLNLDAIVASPLRGNLRHRYIKHVFWLLAGLGCIQCAGYAWFGSIGPGATSFLDGYSTWPTRFLYAFTGLVAAVSFIYLIDRWCVRLTETKLHAGVVGERASNLFQEAHVVKMGLLALVILYVGGVYVYGIFSRNFLCLGVPAIVGLAVVWVFWTIHARGDKRSPTVFGLLKRTALSRELFLGTDMRIAIGCALVCMIAVTIIGAWAQGLGDGLVIRRNNAWSPAYTSRGFSSRQFDWVANFYGFGAVGLLLSAMVYFQLWCREFAHDVLKDEADDIEGRQVMREHFGNGRNAEPQDAEQLDEALSNEYDRLWAIGKLTSVPARLGPVLLGLLLVLMLGYHPSISPVSMPTSLLVMATLFVVLYVISGMSLRLEMGKEREDTLAKLQLRLMKLSRPGADHAMQLAGVTDDGRESRNELDMQVDELVVMVEPQGDSAAVRTINARLQPKQQDSRECVKELLTASKERITELSDGVFQSWNRSPMGWILGGGTTLALLDLWIRWWTIGL